MIGSKLLYAAAAALAATGLGVRLAPAPAPAPPPPPAPDSAPPTAVAPLPARPQPAGYAAIVASNVFSPTRKAPESRFIPGGAAKDSAPPPPRPAKPPEPRMHLYGITRGPSGAVALIDADPQVPGAELYRVGDEVPDGRIARITDSTVVIDGGSRRVVLRLPAGEGPPR